MVADRRGRSLVTKLLTPNTGAKVLYTEEELSFMRDGLTVEEYQRKTISK